MNLEPTQVINDIKFFDSAASCISHFENNHWTSKALSLIKSFGTLFSFALNKIILAFKPMDADLDSLTNTGSRALSKKRLVVCVHGLNSGPSQFKNIIDEIKKGNLSKTDIFIPRVLEKGNATLDEMVKPIFEEIEKWAQTGEKKELVLVGISNGGRISRALEAKIAKSENNANIKKLRFVSIVGACKGSSIVNIVNNLGLSWFLSKNISEEMPSRSKRNQRLDRDWSDVLTNGSKREYNFIASPHDWQVLNYSSSLMEVKEQKASYALVPNHGHVSIVNAVAKTVATIILKKEIIKSKTL